MPLEELFAQAKNWIRENDADWEFCSDPELNMRPSSKLQTKLETTFSTRNIFNEININTVLLQ